MKVVPFIILPLLCNFAYSQNAQDSTTVVSLKEVVITASRLQEDISRSPVSIEKVSLPAIERSASPSFFDGLENVKGIQMITPSLGFKVINMRGFANPTNVRFAQLVDGMDSQAPHLGAPIANTLGPNDLDIESVEVVPGVSSALYGMNAINGLANFITKDPFKYRGFSIQQKTGINRVGSGESASPFSETSFRWAKALSSKLAFKINGTFLSGTDWVADNLNDLNSKANTSTGLIDANNPGYDPVNSYGNESSNQRTLSLSGKNYVVARTGYLEKEVVDYGIRNIKSDASIAYQIRPDLRLTYTGRYVNLNNVYQRSNRFRLEDYQLQQHGLALQGKSIQIRAYLTTENTGNSYNLRSMAENIDNSFKPPTLWFNDYSKGFQNAIATGSTISAAHQLARVGADAGRPQPGSDEFKNLIGKLRDINNWDIGAALRVQSRLFHIEGQINLTQKLLRPFRNKTGIELLAGFDHRTYIIIPDGNYFINPTEAGKDILYSKTGGFIQTSKSFFADKLKISATLRVDKNDYFSTKWNPRASVVYSPTPQHNFRFSFQEGYRFPSIFEAYSNVNSGGVKRVGGLPIMSNGIFENAYFKTSIDAFQAAVNSEVNQQGLTRDQAIAKQQNLLAKNNYTYIQPEHIVSFELGYRGSLLNELLQVDADFYFNTYDNFIAQVEMNVPNTTKLDSIPFYLIDRSKQSRYRMWTNSKTIVFNYGASLGLKYYFHKKFIATGNITYSTLQQKSKTDGLEDGFNTPQWITNWSVGNDQIFKSLGFLITYRWQSNYFWQSFLVNGNVPAYQTVDAQVNFKWEKLKFKIGGTNLFNTYYYSYLGGPSVGGFYYTSVTFNL